MRLDSGILSRIGALDGSAGSDLAVLVNANSKRGGRRVAVEIGRALPLANVRLTQREAETDEWLRALRRGATPPRAIFAAGGDGTAVGLLAALSRVYGEERFPPIGTLPLGTGNAWAHVLGAEKLGTCVRALHHWTGPLPCRRYSLLECDGILTFFAGSGWDAQVLSDYRSQIAMSTGPLRRINKSVYGYLGAIFLRAAPRALMFGRPRVLIENLGEETFAIDANGTPKRLANIGPGAVLYDGPASVVGCATCPEYGFRFRAFPFAERLPKFMHVRVYDQTALRALAAIPQLWRGAHPLAGMHDWLASAVRMTFSRPSPLQIAGEAAGLRTTVEYRAFPREIDVVDFRGLYRDPRSPVPMVRDQ
jgi:diacylglycerol kinase family enzyme